VYRDGGEYWTHRKYSRGGIVQVPKDKIRTLASLLASLTNIEELAEQMVLILKELSRLPLYEPAEEMATEYV
jgi:hypothetical protein